MADKSQHPCQDAYVQMILTIGRYHEISTAFDVNSRALEQGLCTYEEFRAGAAALAKLALDRVQSASSES